jgi:citrate lyase synthetase
MKVRSQAHFAHGNRMETLPRRSGLGRAHTGLGKQLVGELVERSRGHKKIILYAVPGREPFYRKFGFLRMKTAMAIFENQQQQIERGDLAED